MPPVCVFVCVFKRQIGTGSPLPTPGKKHYVTFHFTDGDNIEWLDGQHTGFEFFSAGKFWDSPGRGKVPLAWGMPTIQSDLGRPVMEYMYDTATPGKDVFVAVSPIGYGYVSKFSPAVRAANAAEQGRRMAQLDMHILNLIDFRPSDYATNITTEELYMPYMQQDAIHALFLYPWDTGYEGNGTCKGSITWANDKPIITGRVALWQSDGCVPTGAFGSSGCRNVTNVANWLNQQAKKLNGTDPTSSSSYSVVPVDVWTQVGDVSSVLKVTELLGPDIEVVSADVLITLIQKNVKR